MHVLQIHEDSLCISQMTSLSSSLAQTPSSTPMLSNNLCDKRNYSSFTWTILSYYCPQTEFREDIVLHLSVCPWGGQGGVMMSLSVMMSLPQTTPPPWTAPPWTAPPLPHGHHIFPSGQQAGGRHPTAMPSCWKYYVKLILFFSFVTL